MRTMITLPDHTHARAKQRAADLGISLSELGRRLFERELDEHEPHEPHVCNPHECEPHECETLGSLAKITGIIKGGEPQESEPQECKPRGLEAIIGIIPDGEPFSMAENGRQIIEEAIAARFE